MTPLFTRSAAASIDVARADDVDFHGMVGQSPVMQTLFASIARLAPHARAVLITGETGTGKELVARALHNLGGRRHRPYIACNCSAIVETLFESELFGHTRGAFTGASYARPGLFELADSGTLFLDEIGEMPPAMQAKLLRGVEFGEVQRVGGLAPAYVDVRVIAATNRNLRNDVAAGRFRDDLYYRLNVVGIELPPLRDRRGDIPHLSAAFVREFAARLGKPLQGISQGAERMLQQARWPGNIRELRNTLERACMLSDGHLLSERDLQKAMGSAVNARAVRPAAWRTPPPLNREDVQNAIQRAGGNKSQAARALGLSRRALYRRIEALQLSAAASSPPALQSPRAG